MNRVFLVDNSVVQRVHRSSAVAEALIELLALGDFGSCLPQVLEEGYSARGADEYRTLIDASSRAKVFLPPDAEMATVALDLQRRLFDAGIGRSVGISDLQIAATAIRHTTPATTIAVVHYDSDFENIAAVMPEFSHRWIVGRGTVD